MNIFKAVKYYSILHGHVFCNDRAFSSIYVHVAARDGFLRLTFLVAKSTVSHEWAEMV